MRPEASGPLAERQQGINLHAPCPSRKSGSRGYGARRCGATDPPACRKTPSARAISSGRHGNDLRIDIEKTAYRRVATGRQPKPQKTTAAHPYQDSTKHHGSHKPTRPCHACIEQSLWAKYCMDMYGALPCAHRTEPRSHANRRNTFTRRRMGRNKIPWRTAK